MEKPSLAQMVVVAAEHRPEVLADLIRIISAQGLNIHAFEADESGVLLNVAQPDEAQEALAAHGHFCRVIDVLHFDVTNRAGVLQETLDRLSGSGVQILSSFGIGIKDLGAIYIRVDDVTKALVALDA